MALINHVKKEINAKIVLFGPAASGKSTAVNGIYRKLKADCRGKLKSMAVQKDRMLFFDFTPPGQGGLDGYTVRFHVYTLTGEVTSPSSWKMVLKGVDGVVLLVDSTAEGLKNSALSVEQLSEYLGTAFSATPKVILYNKRDLPTALPLPQLDDVLNQNRVISAPAVASRGEGLLEGLSRLVRLIVSNLKNNDVNLAREMDSLAPQDEQGAEDSAGRGSIAPEAVSACEGSSGIAPAVSLSGEPLCSSNGEVTIPVSVQFGSTVKSFTLRVKLSLDEP